MDKEQLEKYLIDTLINTHTDLEKLNELQKKFITGDDNYKEWISKRRSNNKSNKEIYCNATKEEFKVLKSIERDKNNIVGILKAFRILKSEN